MAAELLGIANVLVPIVLCVLTGFSLAHFKIPFDTKMVGGIVANVGYPALILSHLGASHVPFAVFMELVAASVVVVAAFATVGFVFLRLIGLPPRSFLSPMMLNNVGNVGLPISFLAFGQTGLVYSMAFLVVTMIGIFTLAIWIPSGKVSIVDLAKKPVTYALIVSLILMATGWRLPTMLHNTANILGGLAIPLMLLTLGSTLAGLKPGNIRRGAALAGFHLLMAAGVGLAVVTIFGFTGTIRTVFILQCLMPASVATYLWVELYRDKDAPDVASFILVSTLLAVVSLPIALFIWA